MEQSRLTRPLIFGMVTVVLRDRRLRRRRRNLYRSYCGQGFMVTVPGDVLALPESVIRRSMMRVRRHWRRWLAAEAGFALVLGPVATLPASVSLLFIVSAWLVESAWVQGIDLTQGYGRDQVASVLIRELAAIWRGQGRPLGSGYRLMAVGWGLEWVWADQVVSECLRVFHDQAAAARISAAMSSTDSMPTAIRTVPSEIPIACRASAD